jgi:hypothetical protein
VSKPDLEALMLDARLASLEERVASLESSRSGRRALPILVSETGVCGVDPESESSTCPHASIYRRQKGCMGTRCMEVARESYAMHRQKKAVE